MIRALVSSCLRFPALVVALAAGLVVVGATQLRDMPVDVLPEFAPPTVEIQTEALGLSAAEVEQLITVPMEQDLLVGVAFLDDIRSESLPGLSRIFLTFEPGTDLYRARQVVAERMTQAHALPNVSKPPQMLQPLSSTNRVMIVGASSTSLQPIEMGVLARWTIAPRLIGVPGVANVSIWGFRDRQLQVQVDPERLRSSGVSLVDVVETAGNALWFSPLTFVEASTPGTGGFIDTPNQRLGIQHLSPIDSAPDLAKIRIQDAGDSKLVLGDVASVVEDHQPLIGDALVNEGNGDLLFVVEKLPEANTLEVTKGVESTLAAMSPGLPGVALDSTVYRPASFIDSAIGNLRLVLIVGGILVALIIAGFFFRWRTTLVSIVAIPVSLLAGVLALWAFGASMNAIVLAGFAAALVVVIDDAVTGVDNTARRLRNRPPADGDSTASVVLSSTLQARGPLFYATAVIALALMPLFFLDGVAGAFLPDAAAAYLVALLAAMVVALTLTPVLSLLLLRGSPAAAGGESPPARVLKRGYGWTLARVVHRPLAVAVAAGLLVVAALAAAPFVDRSLLPTFKEEQLLVRWDGPPGTSLPEMNRVTALASRALESVPGVRDVGAHVGRAVGSDLSANANTAELWVSIDDGADHDATVAAIRNVVAGYPGLSPTFGSFSNTRANEVLADRSSDDVVVRVYGEEPAVLRAQAERVRQAVAGVDGAAGTRVVLPADEPTVEVEVDLAAAQAQGVKPGDVRRAAATMLGGLVVGNLFEQQKVFEVVVWGTPETRSSLTSIEQLQIDTPDGRHVRLGDVADVRIAPNPAVINRHAVSRYLDVAAGVSGRDRGSVVSDVRNRLAAMQFPLEYHTEILAQQRQPLGRLLGLGIGAAIGIFLLLQACFGSWRLAILSFLVLPAALTGGVLALLATGSPLSLGSAMGLFGVFAIAVRSGILLVDRYLQLRPRGEPFDRDLVLDGALDRVTPTVITALATALAMLTVVVVGGGPGLENVYPVAIAVLGGLVTSTAVVLLVLPPLYLRFGFVPVTEPEARDTRDLVADLAPRPKEPAPAGAGGGAEQAQPVEQGS